MNINVSLNAEAKTITVEVDNTGGANIKGIYIDTQKTYVCNNEFSERATKREDFGTNVTTQVFNLNDINGGILDTADINNDLFFVYVLLCDNINPYMNIVYDEKHLYNLILSSLYKDTFGKCNCSNDYTNSNDKLVFLKGFELADFGREKIYYWNLLHNMDNISNNCSCHGR